MDQKKTPIDVCVDWSVQRSAVLRVQGQMYDGWGEYGCRSFPLSVFNKIQCIAF